MLREALTSRKAQYERRIHDLSWERQRLQLRLADIDKAVSELIGAATEIDNVTRDMDTEAAIQAAKTQEPLPKAETQEVTPNG